MLKKFRTPFIWSVIIIWLPVVIDLFVWNKLPNRIATHYNAQMVPDGWSSKPVAIFVLPLVLTLVQAFLAYLFIRDPKTKDVKSWMNTVILLIIPVISLFINSVMLFTALGTNVDQFKGMFLNLLSGVTLIILGIVLKSVKPNQVIGFRLSWTLKSTENWQRTHRLASKLFIYGGIFLLIMGVSTVQFMFVPILLIMIIVPCVYSFVLHKRGI